MIFGYNKQLSKLHDNNRLFIITLSIFGTIMRDTTAIDEQHFLLKSAEIIDAGKFLYQQGWSPATSSNYSSRLDAQTIAITASGLHKGALTNNDIMVVDLQGQPLNSSLSPSAETLLHTTLYALFPNIESVLHTHSVGATVLSRHLKDEASLVLTGYELQKALAGQTTHETSLIIPIFENSQDIALLAKKTTTYLEKNKIVPAYIIRGHGLYTWGKDMKECLRHIEALEFLIQCEIEQIKMTKG
ncbi:MAG: methylthioribulose-1-phosphate dehydratase [Oleiphilaceae bacterium]